MVGESSLTLGRRTLATGECSISSTSRMPTPGRSGRTPCARWMREPELAARYRNRFAGDRRSIDRVSETLRLGHGQRGWLAVAVAPLDRVPLQDVQDAMG